MKNLILLITGIIVILILIGVVIWLAVTRKECKKDIYDKIQIIGNQIDKAGLAPKDIYMYITGKGVDCDQCNQLEK